MCQGATVAAFLALFALLMVGAVIDIRRRIVPNKLLFVCAVVWILWRGALAVYAPATLAETATLAAGSLAFGVCLLGFSVVYERFRKREALGGGDIKLLTVICLFIGVPYTLGMLFLACLISLIYGLALRKTTRTIPMVPCIACASMAVVLFL